MPLATSANASFLINQNTSITIWAGGFETNEQKKLKYIVRDLALESWGSVGTVMDLQSENMASGYIGPFFGSGSPADLICKKISDNKIFVAVRPISDGRIYYTFGTIAGSTITFTPYNVLQNGGTAASAGFRSISALVVPTDTEPVIFFSYCDGPGFFIIKITESGTDSVVDLVSSSAYPHYTRLIKKNNLVIASYVKTYESSQTFSGCKPAVRAYNYNPFGKTLSSVNGGTYEVNVPLLNSNYPTTNLDIFFTGEGYNFMIIGPEWETAAIPA